ncbi:MAG: hypothetical protein IPQ07_16945 [Myxococcales bacterium]|nr:hypothetical protein [Myxococcales bacterium]
MAHSPKEEFKKIIDERLKVAEASGVTGAEYYEKEVLGKGVPQFRSKVQGAAEAGGTEPRSDALPPLTGAGAARCRASDRRSPSARRHSRCVCGEPQRHAAVVSC